MLRPPDADELAGRAMAAILGDIHDLRELRADAAGDTRLSER